MYLADLMEKSEAGQFIVLFTAAFYIQFEGRHVRNRLLESNFDQVH